MTERRIILSIAIAASLAVLGIGLFTLTRASEPGWDGETLGYWMAHWYRQGGGVDASANAAVREIGTNGLPYYIKWMKRWRTSSSGPSYQSWALRGFKALGSAGAPAIPELIGMLDRGGNSAGLALAFVGLESVPALTNYLATNYLSKAKASRRRSPWMGTRNALWALQYIGTNAESALPALFDLQRTGRIPAESAAETIPVIGANRPDVAVPGLISMLTNSAPRARGAAAKALGAFGSKAEGAIPQLQTACTDPHSYVRTWAAVSLKTLAPGLPGALDPLIDNLRSSDRQTRQEAHWALERLGTNATEVLPTLTSRSLRDPLPGVRVSATRWVAKVGACDDSTLDVVIPNLDHETPSVRSEAQSLLYPCTFRSIRAFHVFLRARQSPYGDVSNWARDVEPARKNPDWLSQSFTNHDPLVRYGAFRALYNSDALEDPLAVAAFRQALGDEDPQVRSFATNTLNKWKAAGFPWAQ